jgi:hypothetical protein
MFEIPLKTRRGTRVGAKSDFHSRVEKLLEILAIGVVADAQQIGKVARIGFLDNSTASGMAVLVDAFRQTAPLYSATSHWAVARGQTGLLDLIEQGFRRISAEELREAVASGVEAPVVVKLLEGTQGIGVVLAESTPAASSVIEAFHGLDQNILIQKFIKEAQGSDIRALVVGRKVVAAMRFATKRSSSG